MTTKTMSRSRLWTAGIMSGLVILFMLFDSVMKFMKPEPVVEGTLALGYAEHHIVVIGVLGLLSTILYAIPRTSVLGAVLLTGYFGGAIATHIRMDNPLFSHTLFPVYIAILTWGGIWLRNDKVRRLFPLQNRGD
ncbi:DoxX family protein [Paenibacillus sp. sptzw28]|nr:DoxX family protein [Paenibacillus sp. sptzw28]